ncbi:hypothetical protein LdCL_280020200 [Leishmania donovani]|uniref:UmuC domain-containing protein n=1 Tax=Leishmania donovani TaxID=5661 RepID=A0A3S7X1H5_LEIDO|nr:hypothetical protein LdCL_280020200 [Leishmania donovani]
MSPTTFVRTRIAPAEDVCAEFRRRVEAATQPTCSGGIAHTPAFAKVGSNVNKPNGQHILTLRTREEVLAHVRDMPVRDVPGIGFATEQRLHALGVVTCKDFLTHKAELCYLFREKTFAFYLSVGLGLVRANVNRSNAEREAVTAPPSAAAAMKPSSAAHLKSRLSRALASPSPSALRAVVPDHRAQKSTRKCTTLACGVPICEAFWYHLRQLTQGAHDVLMKQGAGTKHVCFYTTSRAFVSRSHAAMLSEATNSFAKLYAGLEKVAEPFAARHREFRLIGVKFSKLQPLPVGGGRRSAKGKGAAPVCKAKVKAVRHYPKPRDDAAALCIGENCEDAAISIEEAASPGPAKVAGRKASLRCSSSNSANTSREKSGPLSRMCGMRDGPAASLPPSLSAALDGDSVDAHPHPGLQNTVPASCRFSCCLYRSHSPCTASQRSARVYVLAPTIPHLFRFYLFAAAALPSQGVPPVIFCDRSVVHQASVSPPPSPPQRAQRTSPCTLIHVARPPLSPPVSRVLASKTGGHKPMRAKQKRSVT